MAPIGSNLYKAQLSLNQPVATFETNVTRYKETNNEGGLNKFGGDAYWAANLTPAVFDK